MSRDRGPVLKRARALGIEPQYLGVNKKSKRHGAVRRRKKSEYGIQLTEKQKVRFTYGLSETQFRNLFEKASKRKGGAGENLLIMLESRLDNVVFRMGFAATRREARQLVNHGHFLVNGKKVDIPSYTCKAGDKIEVKDNMKNAAVIKEALEATPNTPDFVTFDVNKMAGEFVRLPERNELNQQINELLVVEFYNRKM